MRIYLAAPYAARNLCQGVKEQLEQADHVVTSAWINGTRSIDDAIIGAATGSPLETVADHAQGDFNDIDAADVVLMLTGDYVQRHTVGINPMWLHTGGRHVEVGYALAHGKPVHIIGPAENVFSRSFATSHLSVQAFIDAQKEA